MKALTKFVRAIRTECPEGVPYFDPLDGGDNAECLFVLEAPGPKAVGSGFISRNNPDETAKNWFELNVEAGIDRKRTVLWNIVPWYLGDGKRIRRPTSDERSKGFKYLVQLINMLPKLGVVVLVGGQAGMVRSDLADLSDRLRFHDIRHPSPMFINRHPKNRQELLDGLIRVAALMDGVAKARINLAPGS